MTLSDTQWPEWLSPQPDAAWLNGRECHVHRVPWNPCGPGRPRSTDPEVIARSTVRREGKGRRNARRGTANKAKRQSGKRSRAFLRLPR